MLKDEFNIHFDEWIEPKRYGEAFGRDGMIAIDVFVVVVLWNWMSCSMMWDIVLSIVWRI